MPREFKEEISGTGVLFAGDVRVAEVQYRLHVWQETVTSETFGRTEELEGHRIIEGRFTRPAGADELPDLTEHDTLTLHLEDGRRWECVVPSDDGVAVSTEKGLFRPS